MKDAGAHARVPIRRIACGRARCQLVIHVVRIALRAIRLLIHQRLNARHDRRCERRAARARPSARIARARRAAVANIRPAHHIVVAPHARASEERYVGDVAHAIARNSREPRLPRGLRISLARSARHAGGIGRPSGACARAAAARFHGDQPILLGSRTAAKAARSVGCAEAQRVRQQLARARIVPRNLGDVRERGSVGCAIGRTPVSCVRTGERVAEIGAAHRDVIRRRRPRAYADSVRGAARAGIARRGAFIARGHENRGAFRRRLLKSRVEDRIRRLAVRGLADAVAHADDGRRIGAVDQILQRDHHSIGRARIRAGRHHDLRRWRGGGGPFRIERRFAIVAVRESGRGAIVSTGGRRGLHHAKGAIGILRKAEGGTERIPIGIIVETRVFDNGDGLPAARISGAEQRRQIVDGREIGRRDRLFLEALRGERILRTRFLHRAPFEIVHRDNASDHRRERVGNLRIAHVSHVAFAIHIQPMDLGMERAPDLPGRARKVHGHPVGKHRVHLEALRLQPRSHAIDVGLCRAERRAELCGAHPFVERWRFRIMQRVHRGGRRRFLFRRTPQLQQHVVHGEIVRHRARVVFRPGFRTRVPRKPVQFGFIHRRRDERTRNAPVLRHQANRQSSAEDSDVIEMITRKHEDSRENMRLTYPDTDAGTTGSVAGRRLF